MYGLILKKIHDGFYFQRLKLFNYEPWPPFFIIFAINNWVCLHKPKRSLMQVESIRKPCGVVCTL